MNCLKKAQKAQNGVAAHGQGWSRLESGWTEFDRAGGQMQNAAAVARPLADELAARACRVQNRKQGGNDKVGGDCGRGGRGGRSGLKRKRADTGPTAAIRHPDSE